MTETLTFQIPAPLKTEHDELHAALARATKEPGEVGAAAREVARILHPHFVAEEEFALPPLGLLPALAKGMISPAMAPAIDMTRRLRSELPRMLDEHKAIVAALRKLVDESRKAGRSDLAVFAEKLILHAQTEEEVLYPAAVLIGEHLQTHFRNDEGPDPARRGALASAVGLGRRRGHRRGGGGAGPSPSSCRPARHPVDDHACPHGALAVETVAPRGARSVSKMRRAGPSG